MENIKNEYIVDDKEIQEINDYGYRMGYLDGIRENAEKTKKQKDYAEMLKERSLFHSELIDSYGNFYFNFYQRLGKVDRQYLFRFLYLSSFMNYDNYLSNGKRLYSDDEVFELLNLGRTETYKTKKYLIDNEFIIINKNNTISINDKYCKKGEITKKKSDEVVRMFNSSIREIYENANPRQHKKLALLIELLPYINLKFNVICENPSEENEENIVAYDIKSLCSLLGSDPSNASRLKKDLFSLKVNDEDVIGMFTRRSKTSIYVNPRVYYKGTRTEDVGMLRAMFKI